MNIISGVLEGSPWLLPVLQAFYYFGVVLLAVKIIMDTKTVTKTLAYLLLILFLPVVGIIIYLVFGVNYRKNQFFYHKLARNQELREKLDQYSYQTHREVTDAQEEVTEKYRHTVDFLFRAIGSPLTNGNALELLKNGGQKFDRLFDMIRQARHHIHLEYYIWENDNIGNALADLLIEKAAEGVQVKAIFDDFGSRNIRDSVVNRMRQGGVEIIPFNRVTYRILANRMNYRDHRKVVIVDGEHVFVGGANVADRYINKAGQPYWRDTHLYIRGPAVFYFQYLFFSNWQYITGRLPVLDTTFFTNFPMNDENHLVQVAASGPDTSPNIMLSTTSAIYAARQRIFITTPYFIPVEAISDALMQVAATGLDVRILVPRKGDSRLVNAAAYSYYADLLKAGVRLYFYERGFLHTKSMLIDDDFSMIGTANLDVRSQELNFEVNALIYDKEMNASLEQEFRDDLKDASEITLDDWSRRSRFKVFFEHLARLLSPLL
jgi:cardiolipin synthase